MIQKNLQLIYNLIIVIQNQSIFKSIYVFVILTPLFAKSYDVLGFCYLDFLPSQLEKCIIYLTAANSCPVFSLSELFCSIRLSSINLWKNPSK